MLQATSAMPTQPVAQPAVAQPVPVAAQVALAQLAAMASTQTQPGALAAQDPMERLRKDMNQKVFSVFQQQLGGKTEHKGTSLADLDQIKEFFSKRPLQEAQELSDRVDSCFQSFAALQQKACNGNAQEKKSLKWTKSWKPCELGMNELKAEYLDETKAKPVAAKRKRTISFEEAGAGAFFKSTQAYKDHLEHECKRHRQDFDPSVPGYAPSEQPSADDVKDFKKSVQACFSDKVDVYEVDGEARLATPVTTQAPLPTGVPCPNHVEVRHLYVPQKRLWAAVARQRNPQDLSQFLLGWRLNAGQVAILLSKSNPRLH